MDDVYALQMQALGEMSQMAAPQVTYEDQQHNTQRPQMNVQHHSMMDADPAMMNDSSGSMQSSPSMGPGPAMAPGGGLFGSSGSNMWMYLLIAAAAFLLWRYMGRS